MKTTIRLLMPDDCRQISGHMVLLKGPDRMALSRVPFVEHTCGDPCPEVMRGGRLLSILSVGIEET